MISSPAYNVRVTAGSRRSRIPNYWSSDR